MQVPFSLSFDRIDDSRVRMTDAGHANTGKKVEILFAILIDDYTTLRVCDCNTHRLGRGLTNKSAEIIVKGIHDLLPAAAMAISCSSSDSVVAFCKTGVRSQN